jgi:hypothetical protein
MEKTGFDTESGAFRGGVDDMAYISTENEVWGKPKRHRKRLRQLPPVLNVGS